MEICRKLYKADVHVDLDRAKHAHLSVPTRRHFWCPKAPTDVLAFPLPASGADTAEEEGGC